MKSDTVFVTKNNGKTIIGYDISRFKKFEKKLLESGYTKASKKAIDKHLSKLGYSQEEPSTEQKNEVEKNISNQQENK